MRFQGGHLKLTFNSLEPRPDSIKFKELISGDWNFILLSSYCTDYEWLLNQFEGISPGTEINLVEHYDKTTGHAGIQKITTKYRTINLVHPTFPKFPSYGVMHCKLIILASKDFMRIVVSSANLMDFDYEDVQNVSDVWDMFVFMFLFYTLDCFCSRFTKTKGKFANSFKRLLFNGLSILFGLESAFRFPWRIQ